jgi:outer membrane protein OmpA-like peptidoglycan-associated protein
LDDVRARAVYNYLKKLGISDDRMSFQGEGTGDSRTIVVQISEL